MEFKNQNDITLNSKGVDDKYLVETSFSKGGYLDVFFDPKQIFLDFDTWNINSVVLNLVFIDQNGALNPRQINFSNAQVLLQKNQQRLRLPFDNRYNAGSGFLPGL